MTQPIWIGCPAQNFRSGRHGFKIEAIVVHIMDGSFQAGESVFADPGTQKSAHYGISNTGLIHQYVDENDTAFHAGIVVNPSWPLIKPGINPNLYTVGIEHEGRPDDVWPDAQLSSSATLIQAIAARWAIPIDDQHVIRHHQIRASKTCPGNWLNLDLLLKRIPSAPPQPPVVSSTVRALKNVNLRKGRPNTAAPVAKVIVANTNISIAGFTSGERVHGNANWFADGQGNYFWAGATDMPFPQPAG